MGTSVLLAADGPGVLFRVDDRVPAGRAARQVAVAQALERLDVPAVRLAGAYDQPFTVEASGNGPMDTVEVTLWRLEEPTGTPVGPATVGHLAARLHQTTASLHGRAELEQLPVFDPFLVVAEQLAAAASQPTSPTGHGADLELLAARSAELAARWPGADTATGIVHGDLHAQNVLMTRRGALLADLELAGVGPVLYDLVAPVVAIERYGWPATYLGHFVRGYGAPVPGAARRGVLRDTYELWLTAWAVANRHLDRRHGIEARRRLVRWRSPSGTAPTWTLR
jgi:aminoglycoside phosphotransferase (APT) family kinase protein